MTQQHGEWRGKLDLLELGVSAVVGAGAGLLLQNLLYPRLARATTKRATLRHHKRSHAMWRRWEELTQSRLTLVQSGWDVDGFFTSNSIRLKLEGEYQASPSIAQLREAHEENWVEAGRFNGAQIGIASLDIARVSDDPATTPQGATTHRISIKAHKFKYFDFLATHMLRLDGDSDERAALDAIAGGPKEPRLLSDFPNPCSVGLSVLCEGSSQLMLLRRSRTNQWEPGKIFNAVGEGVAPRDFHRTLSGEMESTPERTAARGLYEEVGLPPSLIELTKIRIHSLAWATDLLDYKFFGVALIPSTRGQIQSYWRSAVDRAESEGMEGIFRAIETGAQCRSLIKELTDKQGEWAPEAVFCTIFSLLRMRKITIRDFGHLL